MLRTNEATLPLVRCEYIIRQWRFRLQFEEYSALVIDGHLFSGFSNSKMRDRAAVASRNP